MPVNIIDTLKPKNNGSFPVVEAADVAVSEELRLQEALAAKADASDLASTDALVATKANASDVAASTAELQGEIDQIVISASAEAVVAPEVAAARVGADGTSYQTLKARLDTESTDLKREISEFGKTHYNRFNKSTVTAERYVNSDTGVLSYSANYYTSDYIDVSDLVGEELTITYAFSGAFYDSSKTYSASAAGTKTGNTRIVTVPVGAKYLRVSGENSNLSVMQVGTDVSESSYYSYDKIEIKNAVIEESQVIGLEELDGEVQNARNSYASLKQRLDTENSVLTDSIADFGKERINRFDTSTITEQRYINPDTGALVFSVDYSTSDYIDVSDLTEEEITVIYSFSGAFYDSNKTYVSSIGGTKVGNVRTTVVPATAAYLRVCCENNNLNSMQVGPDVSESQYVPFRAVKISNAILEQSQVKGLNELDLGHINRFDASSITEQRYIDPEDGSLEFSADYYTSDYIDVEDLNGQELTITYSFDAAFYDASKEFVSMATGTKKGNVRVVTVPSGVKYVRVSGNNTDINVMQVGVDISESQYYGFGTIYIDNVVIRKNQVVGLSVPKITHINVGINRAIKTINAALSSITDASENNRYVIHLDKGTYEETFHTKNYVDIVGENKYQTIITYSETDPDLWNTTSTIFAETYSTLENLTILADGVKYPIHSDGAYNIPYRVIIKNCILRHNGASYDDTKAGTGIGIGLYHSQHVELIECEIYGKEGVFGSADIYCHNSADTDEAHSKYRSLRVERCVLGECTYGIRLQAIEDNQLQDNDCWLISNINNGTTPEYFQYVSKDSWHVHKF
jgi:hypothetical protein